MNSRSRTRLPLVQRGNIRYLTRPIARFPGYIVRERRWPQCPKYGDVILPKAQQGARDERHAAAIEQNLRQFEIKGMLSERLAVQAACDDRTLRERGVTVRKTRDMIIGT
jgi:hypothetical protein